MRRYKKIRKKHGELYSGIQYMYSTVLYYRYKKIYINIHYIQTFASGKTLKV